MNKQNTKIYEPITDLLRFEIIFISKNEYINQSILFFNPTFWSINFMAADGHQVNLQIIHIQRDLSHRLCCVGMEMDALLAAKFPCKWSANRNLIVNPTDFLERLPDTDLIVYLKNWIFCVFNIKLIEKDMLNIKIHYSAKLFFEAKMFSFEMPI